MWFQNSFWTICIVFQIIFLINEYNCTFFLLHAIVSNQGVMFKCSLSSFWVLPHFKVMRSFTTQHVKCEVVSWGWDNHKSSFQHPPYQLRQHSQKISTMCYCCYRMVIGITMFIVTSGIHQLNIRGSPNLALQTSHTVSCVASARKSNTKRAANL